MGRSRSWREGRWKVPKNPPETKYALGMAKGGVIWWEDGEKYVDLLRTNGEVMLVALGRSEDERHPKLARELFLTFASNALGITLEVACGRFAEVPTDPFWDDLASVLIQTRLKKGQ